MRLLCAGVVVSQDATSPSQTREAAVKNSSWTELIRVLAVQD